MTTLGESVDQVVGCIAAPGGGSSIPIRPSGCRNAEPLKGNRALPHYLFKLNHLPQGNSQMHRVLVVDDEALTRQLLTLALEKKGFTVTAASDAPEAIALMNGKGFDAVVLDVEMPGQSGVECLVAIRANPRWLQLPVIMISATPLRDVIMQIAYIGVQGVIAKNANLVEHLVRRLHEALPVEESVPASKQSAEHPAPAHVRPPAAPTPTASPKQPAAPTNPGDKGGQPDAHHHALADNRAAPPHPPQVSSEELERQRASDDAESLRVSLLHVDGLPDPERAIEELKRLKPLMSRTELLQRVVEGSDPKAIRPAVQQVLSLTNSSTASVDTIARAIKQDQALSLKVLKVANSSLYTRGERVETIHKAVARIGLTQIRTTVLSLSVIDEFADVNLANRIRSDWFWEHSLATGLLAARLTQMQGKSTDAADTMFTAGLLHDVGRVLFAERLGEVYAGVIDVADRLELPLETVESRLLLVNHADLTDRLLRAWNFSPELINPIALHHLSVGNIRRIVPRGAESVATLGLANALAHCLLLGSSGNQSIYPIEEYLQFLSISRESLDALCADIVNETCDMKLAMLSHGGGEAKTTVLDELKEQLGVELCPLHIALEPGTHPVGLLLGRMGGVACEKPNIAVIRSKHARERSELMSKLQEAEQQVGVSGLPTLVIGSGVGCFFAEGWLGSRRVEQLTIPCRVGRIIRALSGLLAPAQAEAAPTKQAA